MRHVPDFNPAILKAMESSHPLIRLEALRAAGEYEVEHAWPHVRAILARRAGAHPAHQ